MAWNLDSRVNEIVTLLKTITLLGDNDGNPHVLNYEPTEIPRYPMAVVKFAGSNERKKSTGMRWVQTSLNIDLYVLYADASTADAQMKSLVADLRTKLYTYYDPTYSGIIDNEVTFDQPFYLDREQPILVVPCRFTFEETVTL